MLIILHFAKLRFFVQKARKVDNVVWKVCLGLLCGEGRAAVFQIQVADSNTRNAKCTSFKTLEQVVVMRSSYDETSYNGTVVSYLIYQQMKHFCVVYLLSIFKALFCKKKSLKSEKLKKFVCIVAPCKFFLHFAKLRFFAQKAVKFDNVA